MAKRTRCLHGGFEIAAAYPGGHHSRTGGCKNRSTVVFEVEMSFETYFRITSYGLVLAAAAALAVTGEVDAVSLVVYALAASLSAYVDFRGYKRFHVREWMWRLATILYIPFVFVDAEAISRSKILALVHLTLFASAAKLFQDKRDRDWVFLYLIGFFQILLAASLTFNATFIGSMAVYVFFFVSTLAAFEIKRSRREVATAGEEEIARAVNSESSAGATASRPRSASAVRSKGAPRRPESLSRMRYLLGASLVQLLLVAMLTLPLFFLIPRFGGNALASSFSDFEPVTGFSDTVTLGQVARIKTSTRVVMRVKLDSPPGRWLRWRGVALDHYDGRAWTFTAFKNRERIVSEEQRVAGAPLDQDSKYLRTYLIEPTETIPFSRGAQDFSDSRSTGVSAGGGIVRQDFYLEPVDVNGVLFAAGRLLRIRGPIRTLKVSPDTRAVSSTVRGSRMMYSAWSNVQQPNEQQLRTQSFGDASDTVDPLMRLNLQLPTIEGDGSHFDPRISRLAHEITASLPTEYDKAKAIEHYLKTKYGYTLNLKPTNGDPLAEFLFDVKEGHCEYFATAMVIMLRTLGIPARIVNGFQMGEYNEVNEAYTVREQDAHSWVEAYFPGAHSWVEFDPTPAAGINDYSRGGLVAQMRKYMDAAEAFWLDYVVTLDRDQQAGIMISLQHRLLAMKQALVAYYGALRRWMLNLITYLFLQRRWGAADLLMLFLELAAVAGAIMAIYIARSYVKLRNQSPTGYCPWWKRVFILPTWRRGWWFKRDQRRSAVLFYEQMLAILARARLIKSPDQTPLEFAAAQKFAEVNEITRAYNNVRFGGAVLNEAETRRVARLLSELKSAVRKR